MGGNNAIESAAEFVNALIERMKKGSLEDLTTADIQKLGKQVQAVRYKRTKYITALSHRMQAHFAREYPMVSDIVWRGVAPMAGEELPIELTVDRIIGGSRLTDLPVPLRPHCIPYDHELPEKPLKRLWKSLPPVLFIVVMGYTVLDLSKARPTPLLEEFYSSTASVDAWCGSQLIQAENFSSVKNCRQARHPNITVPVVYFLSQLLSPILIFTIEGYRAGNKITPLALASVYCGALQVLGFGRTAALHALFSGLFEFQTPAGRRVQREIAQALLPAVTIGYLLPMLVIFASPASFSDWKILLWYLSPLLFPSLVRALSRLGTSQKASRGGSTAVPKGQDDLLRGRYSIDDASLLNRSYDFVLALQAAVHVSIQIYAVSFAGQPFLQLLNLPSFSTSGFSYRGISSVLLELFQHDVVWGMAVVVVSNLHTVWGLRRRGYIATCDATKAIVGVFLGQLLIGPGATWSLLWRWREKKIIDMITTG